MHGVCDGIAADLVAPGREIYDHRYFEGLLLGSAKGIPLYFVILGS